MKGVRDRGERSGAEEREATRETCTLRCTRTRERERETDRTWPTREKAMCERESEREREHTHTRVRRGGVCLLYRGTRRCEKE